MPRLTTILVLLDSFAVRAEVRVHRRGVDVKEITRIARQPQSDADEAIDRLAAGNLTGGVLVLTDDAFLQTIELPPRAIAGLDARALEQALAYEAQTFSGLVSGDTDLAWHRDGDDRQFLVLQYGKSDFAAIQDAIGRAGGTLLGVAHPAGVPLPLAGVATGERFHRAEQWGGVRAQVRGGDGAQSVRVTRAGEALAAGEALTEQLVVRSAGPAPAASNAQRFDLTTDEGLAPWLQAWAWAVARGDRRVVALAPPEPAGARNRRLLHAGVLVIAAVVAGALDRTARQQDVLAANARLAATRAPLDRLQQREAEIAALTQQLAEAATQPLPRPADASAWSAAVAVAVLEGVAAERPVGLVVDEISLGWRKCSVRGRASSSPTVDTFAAALAPRLALVGYDVVPGVRQQVAVGVGSLFEFTLDLQEAAVAKAAPAPAPVPEDGR